MACYEDVHVLGQEIASCIDRNGLLPSKDCCDDRGRGRENGEVEVRGSSICRKRQTVALPDSLLFVAAAIDTAVLEDRHDFLHEFLDIVRCSWWLKRVAVDRAVFP